MSASENFHNTCNTARTKFAQYCSEPPPRDLTVKFRWTMCGAHLMFVECVQNIYRRAETITPAQEQAFAFMCHCVIALIHHHHHLEETTFFPALEPEFKTDVKIEHDAFEIPLNALEEYLKNVLCIDNGKLYGQTVPALHRKREAYDGAKIKRYLEDLAGPLFTHLSHEIDWLDPENLRASGIAYERFEAIARAEEHHVKTQLDPFTCLVAAWGHLPSYCQFPDMPFLVKRVLIPWGFYWKHRASWQFFPTWSEKGLPVVEKA